MRGHPEGIFKEWGKRGKLAHWLSTLFHFRGPLPGGGADLKSEAAENPRFRSLTADHDI
jgi:hypothetical protein